MLLCAFHGPPPQRRKLSHPIHRRYNEELHFLSLRHCCIGDIGGSLLAYGLRRNQSLVYLNVSHNALGMIGGRSLLRVKRSKMELLHHQCSSELFLFDDPFFPKPVAAVPSASLPREYKLVGVVAIPRMPIGFKKGDVVVDMSRCSIDSIGAITPDLLNMDNPNNHYELDLANIRDRWRHAACALFSTAPLLTRSLTRFQGHCE